MLDRDVDLGALALGEAAEHVVGTLLLGGRLAHTDADALELVRVQVVLDGAQAVVPGKPAT